MPKQIPSPQEWLAKASQAPTPEEQIHCCTQALELDPELPLAYFKRGNGYANLGQNAKAIADYDQALYLDSKVDGAFINRGFTYANLGQYEKAIEDYDRALDLSSELEDAYYNKACACARMGKTEEALNNLRRALRIAPHKYCDQSRNDGVFEKMRASADFQNLLREFCAEC